MKTGRMEFSLQACNDGQNESQTLLFFIKEAEEEREEKGGGGERGEGGSGEEERVDRVKFKNL